MKGYCDGCKRKVNGIRKNWNWLWFFATFGLYFLYHYVCKLKRRCPICGLKIHKKMKGGKK